MKAARLLVLSASSALGLGYLPKMPGTFGTLAAIPIWWALSGHALSVSISVTAAAILVAIWIAGCAEAIYGKHDAQRIVIDEVVGLLTAAIGVPFAWPEVLAAFLLFRFFDMTKPPPIRTIDRRVPGGLGVVLDDVAAGAVSCALLHTARVVHGGWW